MRGYTGGAKRQTERALACGGQPVVGRLTIDQPAALPRRRVGIRGPGAEASHLFVHHEQQADLGHAFRAQPFGGGDLGRRDSLGVARPAPVEDTFHPAGGDVGWHGIEMGREQHPGWVIGRGEHIGTPGRGVE